MFVSQEFLPGRTPAAAERRGGHSGAATFLLRNEHGSAADTGGSVGLLLALTVAGCAPGHARACSEVGWINRVEIGVRGAAADAVADLEVCIDDVCTDPDGAGAVWAEDVGMSTPTEIDVTALAADGSELARGTLAVTWTGTDSPNGPGCPNGSTSERVFLEVG